MVKEDTIQKYAFINGAFETCKYVHDLLRDKGAKEVRAMMMDEMNRMGQGHDPSFKEEPE